MYTLDENCDMQYAREQENTRAPRKVKNETVNFTSEKNYQSKKTGKLSKSKVKVRSKKRKENPEMWKRNVKKAKRLSGKQYTSASI